MLLAFSIFHHRALRKKISHHFLSHLVDRGCRGTLWKPLSTSFRPFLEPLGTLVSPVFRAQKWPVLAWTEVGGGPLRPLSTSFRPFLGPFWGLGHLSISHLEGQKVAHFGVDRGWRGTPSDRQKTKKRTASSKPRYGTLSQNGYGT